MKSLILSALFFALASCTSTPPVEYQLPEKEPYSERVQVELETNCQDGICEVSESNLQRLMDIITKFNDRDERRVDAYNHSNLALYHCSFSNEKLNQAIQASETLRTRESIISGAKQLILGGVCAALLIGK